MLRSTDRCEVCEAQFVTLERLTSGRVGRAAGKPRRIGSEQEGGNARVEALVASTDGFELASLRRDRELVSLAREAAFEIVDADPGLARRPVLFDELDLLFTEEDEGFLAKC